MPRKNRVWYPGAMYHIMSRGNHRGDIFREETDYQMYLRIIAISKSRYPFELYDYCLMTNHVHLQIETINCEIWHIMKYINLVYTKYFNEKYNLIGHLFQGRYNAEIIADDAYTLQTSRYIHLNPVKAKMVSNPADYPWSSYNVFMGVQASELVNEYKILKYFESNSRQSYKKFVEGSYNFNEIDEQIEIKMEGK